MKATRTVICKLALKPEQVADIDATLKAFASACDFAAAVARRIGSTSKRKVQKVAYRDIRKTFGGLSANLAIEVDSAFAPTSIDYDARIFKFRERDWTFSLTLLPGRKRLVTTLGDRQREMLKGQKPTAAQLVRRRDGVYFLHVQLTGEAPAKIETNGTLGVDLGVVNLAVDSDGETFKGDTVEATRKHYSKRRKDLQSKGTKSAKRKLRKIRRKEADFRKDRNHKISKAIVAKAQGTARAIGVEDLGGIGERTTVKKPQRSRGVGRSSPTRHSPLVCR